MRTIMAETIKKEEEIITTDENQTGDEKKEEAEKPSDVQNPEMDTKLVKLLRNTIKEKDKQIKEIQKQTEATPEIARRLEKLEFREEFSKKFPDLTEKLDDIYSLKEKYPQLGFDEVRNMYVGQNFTADSAPRSMGTQINASPREKAIHDMPIEELVKKAEEEWNAR